MKFATAAINSVMPAVIVAGRVKPAPFKIVPGDREHRERDVAEREQRECRAADDRVVRRVDDAEHVDRVRGHRDRDRRGEDQRVAYGDLDVATRGLFVVGERRARDEREHHERRRDDRLIRQPAEVLDRRVVADLDVGELRSSAARSRRSPAPTARRGRARSRSRSRARRSSSSTAASITRYRRTSMR